MEDRQVTHRILVAEDQADIRELLRLALTAAGYEVETAPDGGAAWELAVEREELRRNPDLERRELVAVYVGRGVPRAIAEDFVEALMRDPDVALQVHSHEELGIDPSRTGSPFGAAASSFVSFAIGAVIPLIPWFFATGWGAALVSIVLGALAAAAIGCAIGYYSERSMVRAAVRQLLITAGAAAVTFGVGRLVGVGVTTAT